MQVQDYIDDNAQLGADILLEDGDFVTDPTGDIEVCDGRASLVQDIVHGLPMALGDIIWHADHGGDLIKLLHADNDDFNRLTLQENARTFIEADPRLVQGSVVVRVLGWDEEELRLQAIMQPVAGGNSLNLVVGYDLQATEIKEMTWV